MLEDFFVVPAAAKRLRSSLFGEHLDEFCSVLVGRGYALRTIRLKLWTVAGLAHWLAKRHLSITELDERRVEEFLDVRRRWRRRGARETVLCLLGQLRAAGIVSTPAPVVDDSPSAALLRSYECRHRRPRAPLPPGSPVPMSPPGGTGTHEARARAGRWRRWARSVAAGSRSSR